MSSPAQTLGSRHRIPLEAWLFVRVYSVSVVLCVGSGLATGSSPVQGGLPTVYNIHSCRFILLGNGLERFIRWRRRWWEMVSNTESIGCPITTIVTNVKKKNKKKTVLQWQLVYRIRKQSHFIKRVYELQGLIFSQRLLPTVLSYRL
jgi:predicted membrane chloride channel (bestrophin family)